MALHILLGAMGGLALGLAFFGTLSWTVTRLPRSGHPAALLSLSLLGRLAMALAVLYAIGRGLGAAGLLAALTAFILVRQAFLLQARR